MAFEVLQRLPTNPRTEAELRNNERCDWQDLFENSHFFIFLYNLNALVRLMKREEWISLVGSSGTADLILGHIFNDLLHHIDSFADCELVIPLVTFLLQKISKKRKKAIVKKLGSRLVTQIIEFSNRIGDSVSLIIPILCEIAQVLPKYLHGSEVFPSFFEKHMFDENPAVRASMSSVIRVLGAPAFHAQLTSFLQRVPEHVCGEYFTLLAELGLTIDNPTSFFMDLESVLFGRFQPAKRLSLAEQILFKYPTNEFQNGLFRVLHAVFSRISDAPNSDKLFAFIVENVLYNQFTYYASSKATLELVSEMLSRNAGLYSVIVKHVQYGNQFSTTSICGGEAFHAVSRRRGLRNLGATCYMNATLQILFSIPKFREIVLKRFLPDIDWAANFHLLFAKLFLFPSTAVNPEEFVHSFQWYDQPLNPSEQQDAAEFVQMLIDRLPLIDPELPRLFTGMVLHQTSGLSVNFHSDCVEPFVCFALDVTNVENVGESLQQFLVPDNFTGNDQYNAGSLGKIDAQREHFVSVSPPILILQLKRFTYNFTSGKREKINSRYTFPRELDFSIVMKDQNELIFYDLFTVQNHVGVAEGGHYYSYICVNQKEWFRFDDSRVDPLDDSKLPEIAAGGRTSDAAWGSDRYDSAYLLYYKKRGDLNDEFDVSQIDPVIVDKIADEIRRFTQNQRSHDSKFAEFLFELAQKSPDVQFTFDYYFSLLSGSRLVAREDVLNRLTELLHSQAELSRKFSSDATVWGPFLVRGDDPELRKLCANVIKTAIGASGYIESYLQFLRELFPQLTKKWKAFDEFLIPFLDIVDDVDSREWIVIFNDFFLVGLPQSDIDQRTMIFPLNRVFDVLRDYSKHENCATNSDKLICRWIF
jgi:ubiquitin C-terminal hydrolase